LNRKDLLQVKSVAEVAAEFVGSRRAAGMSAIYVRNSRDYLNRFTGQVSASIGDVTVADINAFLRKQETLGPVTKNSLRRSLVTMFSFAKRQGYLHPDRKTAAEQSESFKVPESDIKIPSVSCMPCHPTGRRMFSLPTKTNCLLLLTAPARVDRPRIRSNEINPPRVGRRHGPCCIRPCAGRSTRIR
jgi:hypothetical protein